MGRLKVWLNQQIANILGDFQEREPVEDPSPARACCRIFFMVSLLLGLSLLLASDFDDAPDARVVRIDRLKDKNHAFPSCFLNDDRNSTNCTKWSKFRKDIPVSCPCTNISAPWRNFVKFYVLHENSGVWNMGFTWNSSSGGYPPEITLPDDTTPLGNESIVQDTENLTAESFCNLSSLWPIAKNSTTSADVDYVTQDVKDSAILRDRCVWMASLLFPGSNTSYDDRTRSTQFLNTPSLLNREGLNTLLAQLARDSVLSRRLALDMVLSLVAGFEDFRRFINALAHLLTTLLDREEMDPSQSYVYGAKDLSVTLSSNQFYDPNAKVWYLGDDSGPIFLQPQIDWEAYYEHCNPQYCKVIKTMRKARKLYWAFGILGGVATISLTVVTKLLWPFTAMLLLWVSKSKTAATRDPKRPRTPGRLELSSPLTPKPLQP